MKQFIYRLFGVELNSTTRRAKGSARREPVRLSIESMEDRLAPATAAFTPLGFFNSDAAAVSADGSVVVGHDQVAGQVYRWTQATGAVNLGFGTKAIDTSADGTVVVGWSNTPSGQEAFRWTPTSGRVGLGELPGGAFDSLGYGVSADGGVVVGDSNDGGGRAFRWTQATGMTALPHYQEYAGQTIYGSVARKSSADGSIISGYTSLGEGVSAVRWVNGLPDYLGDLSGGSRFSDAYSVSLDGSTIVGWSNGTSGFGTGFQAFRWTQATGMVGLGDLPGGAGLFQSIALSVSGDGSVVVGSANFNAQANAFYWTQAAGMVDLKAMLEGAYGLDLTGWQLTEAWDITPDGKTIVGRGMNPTGQDEAWRVQLFDNSAPTDIALSSANVSENQPSGTVVGAFSTTDPDAADTFTLTLATGAGSTDNASFTINGNTLMTSASFDFETKASYSIRVRSIDSGGLSTEKVFTISVTNVNEAPTLAVPAAQDAFEDVDKTISGISVGDVDNGSLTVAIAVSHGTLTLGTTAGLIVTGNGSGSVSLFGSVANLNVALANLVYHGTLNFSGADSLHVAVTDGSLNTSGNIAIAVRSAIHQAADLQAMVTELETTGVLNRGRANSLIVKSNLKGNASDVDKVQSFIDHVWDFLDADILTQAQADALLGRANFLLLSVARR